MADPARMATAPTACLWVTGARRGFHLDTEPAVTSCAQSVPGPGGKAISTATMRPQCTRPGCSSVPSFGHPKATVMSARTTTPGTAPVAPSTPEGASSATIAPPASLAASMAAA